MHANLALDLLIPFCSTNKNQYKWQRIRSILQGHRQLDSGYHRISKLMLATPLGRQEIDQCFKIWRGILRGCKIEEVRQLRQQVLVEIDSQSGISYIDNGFLHFAPGASLDFKHRILHGLGEVSFYVRIFKDIERRLRSAELSSALLMGLTVKNRDLLELQHLTEERENTDRRDAHSELVLQRSWDILNDIRTVNDNPPEELVEKEVDEARDLTLGIFLREFSKIGEDLSDKLMFIIRASHTPKLPASAKAVLARHLGRISKVFSGKAQLLARLRQTPFLESCESARNILENVEMTLLYTIQSVPYQDIFSSPGRRKINDQLRIFTLYGNMLRDITPLDGKGLKFSESTTFIPRYIPSMAGESLATGIVHLEGLNDDKRITHAILKKLCDTLMLDIETWIQRAGGRDMDDMPAVLGLKKWVVLRQFSDKIHCALACLLGLKRSIDDYRESLKHDKLLLPDELIDVLREVCIVFATLLEEEKRLTEIFRGDEVVYLMRRNKDPSQFMLRRSLGVFGKHDTVGVVEISVQMKSLLDGFIADCSEAQQNRHSRILKRFEDLIRSDIAEIAPGRGGIEAMQDAQVVELLLQRPWIKNQSWNRSVVEHLIEICRAITFTVDPAVRCEVN